VLNFSYVHIEVDFIAGSYIACIELLMGKITGAEEKLKVIFCAN